MSSMGMILTSLWLQYRIINIELHSWSRLNIMTVLPGIGIFTIKIRRSLLLAFFSQSFILCWPADAYMLLKKWAIVYTEIDSLSIEQ